jgi:hypothetical protein
MKALKFAVVAAALASVSVASSARAQLGGNPAHVGIAAGIAIPTGDLANIVDNGYNVAGMLQLEPPAMPVAFRLEVGYNSFNNQGGGGSWKESSATANGILNIPSTGIKPYVIGGIGYYHDTQPVAVIGNGSSNHFGFNVGGGIKLPLTGFDTFLEARYHRINETGITVTFIPITFGVLF